jgi:SAM-dependent methyltransferase
VFNKLTPADKNNLFTYYEVEHSPNNLCSPNIGGDIPGSSNENSLRRYNLLFNFIHDIVKLNHTILDIGCATGGFLSYLQTKGHTNLHGIDFSHPYIDTASNKNIDIKYGTAEAVPYKDHQFDFIVADQVVEHLPNPNLIFMEARRLLKNKGYLCISVPNATLYKENSYFDFYWFLMREHIQHFDLHHLSQLAQKHGFKTLKYATSFSHMTSPVTTLPNLSILFELDQHTGYQNPCFSLKHETEEYIIESYKYLDTKRELIHKLKTSDIPFFIYGVSRELEYLYENTELAECNILGFIDDTPYKQKHFTFVGNKIEPNNILEASQEALLITAVAHTDKIYNNLLTNLRYKGQLIEL